MHRTSLALIAFLPLAACGSPCERLGAEVRDISIENQKIIEADGFNPFKPDPKAVKKMPAFQQRLEEIKAEAIERECPLDKVFALDNVFAKAD